MEAQELASTIVTDAQERAAALEAELASTLDAYAQETQELVRAKREALAKEVHAREEEELRKKRAANDLATRQALLKLKGDLIDDTFERASRELARMSMPRRRKLISTLWERATKKLDVGVVTVARKDAAMISRRAKNVRVVAGLGGFSVASKDKRVIIDMRFEQLLEHVRATKLDMIAGILFGDEKPVKRRRK